MDKGVRIEHFLTFCTGFRELEKSVQLNKEVRGSKSCYFQLKNNHGRPTRGSSDYYGCFRSILADKVRSCF